MFPTHLLYPVRDTMTSGSANSASSWWFFNRLWPQNQPAVEVSPESKCDVKPETPRLTLRQLRAQAARNSRKHRHAQQRVAVPEQTREEATGRFVPTRESIQADLATIYSGHDLPPVEPVAAKLDSVPQTLTYAQALRLRPVVGFSAPTSGNWADGIKATPKHAALTNAAERSGSVSSLASYAAESSQGEASTRTLSRDQSSYFPRQSSLPSSSSDGTRAKIAAAETRRTESSASISSDTRTSVDIAQAITVTEQSAARLFAGKTLVSFEDIRGALERQNSDALLKSVASWRNVVNVLRHNQKPYSAPVALAEEICHKICGFEEISAELRSPFSVFLAKISSRRNDIAEALTYAARSVEEHRGFHQLQYYGMLIIETDRNAAVHLLQDALPLAKTNEDKLQARKNLASATGDPHHSNAAQKYTEDSGELDALRALSKRLGHNLVRREGAEAEVRRAERLLLDGNKLDALQALRDVAKTCVYMNDPERRARVHALLMKAGDGGYGGERAHQRLAYSA